MGLDDKVIITYILSDGTEVQEILSDKCTIVDLPGKGIASINLNELRFCKSLESLWLPANELETINLTPISSCTNLQSIWLAKNNLVEIDLSPLKQCQNLQNLDLADNKLTEIDLTPLSSCLDIQNVDLSNNRLSQVDLLPLKKFRNFKQVDLRQNKIKILDPAPFLSNPCLPDLLIDKDVTIKTWFPLGPCLIERWIGVGHETNIANSNTGWDCEYLLRVLESSETSMEPRERAELRYCIFQQVGLEQFRFLDVKSSHILKCIRKANDLNGIKTELQKMALSELCKQIDGGGTALGIEEETIKQSAQLVIRLQRIVEQRRKELEAVKISYNPGQSFVDLSPLWMSAYGFMVLRALGLGIESSTSTLEKIRRELLLYGCALGVNDKNSTFFQTTMSQDLIEYIHWYALYGNHRMQH